MSANDNEGKGIANPDLPSEFKPINFYINKHRYFGSKDKLFKIIGCDLKEAKLNNAHTLYLYNTLD